VSQWKPLDDSVDMHIGAGSPQRSIRREPLPHRQQLLSNRTERIDHPRRTSPAAAASTTTIIIIIIIIITVHTGIRI
jgi:hypothetical protein